MPTTFTKTFEIGYFSWAYFMQYSHAKYLQAAFHENWLETRGSSCSIVSPFLKLTLAKSARPFENEKAHVLYVLNDNLYWNFKYF